MRWTALRDSLGVSDPLFPNCRRHGPIELVRQRYEKFRNIRRFLAEAEAAAEGAGAGPAGGGFCRRRGQRKRKAQGKHKAPRKRRTLRNELSRNSSNQSE